MLGWKKFTNLVLTGKSSVPKNCTITIKSGGTLKIDAGSTATFAGTTTLSGAANVGNFLTFTLTGGAFFSGSEQVAAVTGAQATATVLNSGVFLSVLTACPASGAIRLPSAINGAQRMVYNSGSDTATVFGTTGDTFGAATAATGAITISVGKAAYFSCGPASGNWITFKAA